MAGFLQAPVTTAPGIKMLPGGGFNGPPQGGSRMLPGGGGPQLSGSPLRGGAGNVGTTSPGGPAMSPGVMTAQSQGGTSFGNRGAIAAVGNAGVANPTPQQRLAALNPQQKMAFTAWVNSQHSGAAAPQGAPTSPSGFATQLPSGAQVGYQMGVNQIGHNTETGLAQNQYKINNVLNAFRPNLDYMGYQNNNQIGQQLAANDARGVGQSGVGAEALGRTLAAQAHTGGNFLRGEMTQLGGLGLNRDQLDHLYYNQLQNLLNHKNLALNTFAARQVK